MERHPVRATVSFLLLLCLAALQPAPRAQAPAVGSVAEFRSGDRLPFDGAVKTATLANGLRYYIRQNAQPASRISLRLAVKAGSLDEEDNQRGLAHFLEHMAFNGSTHFAPGELVSYFESAGARLGPHVNAYTSFEETVYRLDLPTDRPDVVRRGLTALADFGRGLTLDPEQVDRERGVVIEEWRGGLGASSRIRDKQLPVLFHQSRYAERLPIGDPDVIRTAPVDRLRSFYDKWYRPDRMALIAVGDADVTEIEAAVRDAFGTLSAVGPATPRVTATVPTHDETLFSIVGDEELTRSSVQLVRAHPSEPETTVGDYRRSLIERLVGRMLSERFTELARRPDAPFLGAGAGGGSLAPDVDTFSLSARVPDGEIGSGLSALALEARRVIQFGFTDSELDRAKRSIRASYERAYNERDKSNSGSFAQEYINHFLVEEPCPGIEYEYQLVESTLPGITGEDVAAMARSRLSGGSPVVLAVSPEKPGLTLPSEAALSETLSHAEGVALLPWADPDTAEALMEHPPEPGTIESRRDLPGVGITVLRFANGVEAWLKPTAFKNDQVMFTMYSLGGLSLSTESSFVDDSLATAFVSLSGVGGFSELELDRMLAGKRASASAFISHSTHGISGSASPTEIETALQLLYLDFTSPNDDPEGFELLKRQLGAMVANRGQNPREVFGDRLSEINTSGHFTSRPITQVDVDRLDREAMSAFYRARFSNAANFTLFLVGAFDPDATVPLLARYVGSLPSTGTRTSTFKDLGVRFPSGIEHARVVKGREPSSQTVISFFADPSGDPLEQERVIAATFVLETTLRDILREELGQTYTVSVGLAQSLPQRGGGHIQVRFGAAPQNIDAMTDRVFAEIKRLQDEGPSAELTARARESARRGYETSLEQNGYWLGRLQTVHLLGRDPGEILTRVERIEAMTPSIVRQALKDYLPFDRYTVVTLVPE